MNGDQIRRTFLEFFQSKGHMVMPSSSLVSAGDPTLLFTSAGMVPFKPFFMGESTPPARRLTSCQKSFRTTDVEEVGDHKHLTFFEMLGNFSIGDYFKAKAIEWAWEFVTQQLKLPPERLYVTIYLDDEEAFQHWTEDIVVPTERIYRYGDKDNWWGPAGKEGPCGPCSEIHYDRGVEEGCRSPDCHPNHDCERFVELWNLVFMQFYQGLDGRRTPLPAPSIDTGLGLERAAAILQGKGSIYETDLFWPIVQKVCDLTSKAYGQDHDTDYAIRVMAEHGRAAAFLIADGVVPGNEGRGYVLRRIIRRAIRYGRRLGLDKPFLTAVADASVERFQQSYMELSTNHDFIMRVVGLEEERFGEVILAGMDELEGYLSVVKTLPKDQMEELDRLIEQKMSEAQTVENVAFRQQAQLIIDKLEPHIQEATLDDQSSSVPWQRGYDWAADDLRRSLVQISLVLSGIEPPDSEGKLSWDRPLDLQQLGQWYSELTTVVTKVPGVLAFRLYDTYGFPPELTAEIAREHGLDVDMEGFEREMEAQRQRARAAHAFTGAMEMLPTYDNLGVGGVEFVGYEGLAKRSLVTGILVQDAPVGHASQGQQVEVVLRETPFYAEAGGQVGDAGVITGPNGKVRVEDTQSPIAGLIVHRGVVEEGDISLGEPVDARVDPIRRLDTARNHSGTHLLHAALRQMLGAHVRQAGSLVAPDRLRFDYSHISPLSREELLDIQALVNQKVRDDLTVSTKESSFTLAVQEGALGLLRRQIRGRDPGGGDGRRGAVQHRGVRRDPRLGHRAGRCSIRHGRVQHRRRDAAHRGGHWQGSGADFRGAFRSAGVYLPKARDPSG